MTKSESNLMDGSQPDEFGKWLLLCIFLSGGLGFAGVLSVQIIAAVWDSPPVVVIIYGGSMLYFMSLNAYCLYRVLEKIVRRKENE